MKTGMQHILICGMGFLLGLRCSCAEPLGQWHQRNPLPQGNNLNGIAFGNGRFVAVGDQGTVLISMDGTNWTVRSAGTTTSLMGITFGAGTFVSVGGSMVYVSADGVTWAQHDPGSNDGLAAIAYGNGRFMAAGGGFSSRLNVATSTNLTDWFIGSTRTVRPIHAVAYGGGFFRIMDEGGDCVTTTDGTSGFTSGYGTFDTMLGLTYGNGDFLAVGTGGDVDGFFQRAGVTNDLYAVAFLQGMFVAVGSAGTIVRSTNGLNWCAADSTLNSNLRALTFGNGLFVAVGEGGRIVTSPDAINWKVRSRGPINPLHRLAEGNGRLVAVGDAGAIVTSANGGSWSLQYSGTPASLADVCFSRGLFVGVGNSDTDSVAVASSDGTNWTFTTVGAYPSVTRVTSSSNIFVAVGYDPQTPDTGVALSSPDGVNWTPHLTGTGTNSILNAVTYGAGKFVAVGGWWLPFQTIVTSDDGSNWVTSISRSGSILNGVTYGGGRFVAAGSGGPMLISSNGVSWDLADPGPPEWPDDVAFINGLFVARSYDWLYSSSDGQHWLAHGFPPSFRSGNLSAGQNSFFLVGPEGTILESDPLLRLALAFGGAVQLTVYGPNGYSCRVDSTEALGPSSSWRAQATFLLTNSTQIWLDPRQASGRRFYRATLLP